MSAFRSRRWEPESDRTPWLLALGVVVGVLGLAWLSLEPSSESMLTPPEPQALSAVEPAVEPLPLTTLRPDVTSPAVPVPRGAVRVYQCVLAGQKVLSDQPCGPDAVERIVDTRELNTFRETPLPMAARPVLQQPAPTGAAPQVPSQPVQPGNAQQCEQILAWIDRINARMRQGYTSQQGEWLRAQWHKAKNAYSDAKCGR
jgi:hypothetical protein